MSVQISYRRFPAILVLLLLTLLQPSRLSAQISIDDAVKMGTQLIQENLDEDFLDYLDELDLDELEDFFKKLQARLQSEYVVDLAELRPLALKFLPILESYEETAPYGAWLRSRLDYLEAADRIKKAMPPPKTTPGKPPPPQAKPSAELERKVWVSIVQTRPVPREAAPYIDRLKAVFKAQGVPAQLAWLAEVESSFNPKAKSPVGAAGLYQLMPATAKAQGLSTWFPDERLNPDKCAKASASYLKYLRGRFADWKLALAAYNCGEGRLAALMARHKAKTFEAVCPYLPAETQMYVPKFEAILKLREGVTLSRL